MLRGMFPVPGKTRGLRPPFSLEGDMEGYFVLIAIAGAGWILFS